MSVIKWIDRWQQNKGYDYYALVNQVSMLVHFTKKGWHWIIFDPVNIVSLLEGYETTKEKAMIAAEKVALNMPL